MPPKTNSKASAGRAKKQENADKKAQAESQKKEALEEEKWKQGAKGKSAADVKAEKAAEAARKKAEKERLQAEDEASTPSKVVKNPGAKAGKKEPKVRPPAFNGPPGADGLDSAITSFSADNLDDALEAMLLVNEKTDKASRGAAAGQIERHPERRFKAAFEAYKERELPKLKEEHKGLRLQQYQDILFKQFQKHPDNPFNQVSVAYDATKEEKLSALQAQRDAAAKRLASQ
ncbi:DUF1014-domain-containing protein [Violaceomyces palustris]|uniref:DUF1014-domain-containing protein n=1 Tax=Violaceomyces palustris TaxID=1673888 RepID=A0ACD0P503_9BASI|nr:DUF1014-domain-containing protein [Violaceomyces palustris]